MEIIAIVLVLIAIYAIIGYGVVNQ